MLKKGYRYHDFSLRMINKVSHKSNDLTLKLVEYFGSEMNLARIKFFGLFITALCKVQTVCFEKLSCAFDSPAKCNSSLRRIQRFMAEYALDSDLIARFVFALLPHKPPYIIAFQLKTQKQVSTIERPAHLDKLN